MGQIDCGRRSGRSIERLSQETVKTANLVIRDGQELWYLVQGGSPRASIFSRIGRGPHCTPEARC